LRFGRSCASVLTNQVNTRRGMPAADHVGDDVSAEVLYVLTSLCSARHAYALPLANNIHNVFAMFRALRIAYFH